MSENQLSEKNNGGIAETITELLLQCRRHWTWFVISFVVIVGMKMFSLIKQEPLYLRSATLLVKEDSSGGQLGNMAATLGELGGFAASSNVDNELEAIQSPSVTAKVIDILKLNVDYTKKGTIKETTLYGSNQPFVMSFPEASDKMAYSVEGVLTDDKVFEINKITSRLNKHETEYDGLSYKLNITQPDSVETEIGRIVIAPNGRYEKGLYADEDVKIIIGWVPEKSVIDSYNKKLRAEPCKPPSLGYKSLGYRSINRESGGYIEYRDKCI